MGFYAASCNPADDASNSFYRFVFFLGPVVWVSGLCHEPIVLHADATDCLVSKCTVIATSFYFQVMHPTLRVSHPLASTHSHV